MLAAKFDKITKLLIKHCNNIPTLDLLPLQVNNLLTYTGSIRIFLIYFKTSAVIA
jgi:hypothetical protein